jgi:hypothetical protein
MALNITTPLNTSIGVTIPTSYARVGLNEGLQGTSIITNISVYATEAAFKSGADPLPVIIEDRFILSAFSFPYNRELEGVDLLELAHEQWVSYFTSKDITATISLDPA